MSVLVDAGLRVYAGAREPGRVPEADHVRPLELDVTDPASVRAAAEKIAAAQGGAGLRAVINNAGVIVQGPLELVPPEELTRQFAVNTVGPAAVTRALLPLLRAGGGQVVNVSAPTARVAPPFMAPIAVSKAALEALSEAQRLELTPWRIPVVLVVPGLIDTPIFATAEAAARRTLREADPDLVALYARQSEAVARAAARQKPAPPETVARVIARAVSAARPRRRFLANADARLFEALSHLPAGPRGRLLRRALGLSGIS